MGASIDNSVLSILQELSKNNNREWFTENKSRFKKEEQKIKYFFEDVKNKMLSFDEIDKMKVYRIYRDVRFSADKTPYKTHFAAHYQRLGQDKRGGYYLHIHPEGSFLAGGFFDPNAEDLLRIRQEFQMDDQEIRKIMVNKKFKERFGEMTGEELKTAPKGFNKEHPAIDLIRKKQFIFTCSYTDEEVLENNFAQTVANDFKLLKPFLDYMSEVLTTNLDGESIL